MCGVRFRGDEQQPVRVHSAPAGDVRAEEETEVRGQLPPGLLRECLQPSAQSPLAQGLHAQQPPSLQCTRSAPGQLICD